MDTATPPGPRLNIALVYELRTTHLFLGYTLDECAELACQSCVEGISDALEKLGHNVVHLPEGIKSLVQSLSKGQEKEWDLVFNYSEGIRGVAREAQVPALLEAYDIPFTFSGADTFALCLDKAKTNTILKSYGISTAPFALIPHDEFDEDYSKSYSAAINAHYPLFAKLNARGTSVGIFSYSKIENPTQLNSTIERLKARYPIDDILVEKFLAGREFTVGIMGTGKGARVIGVTEIVWSKAQSSNAARQGTSEETLPEVIDFATQSSKESLNWEGLANEVGPDVNDPKVILASQAALDAYRVLRCRDLGRIDVRFGSGDDENVPYVIDVNPIPGIHRNWSVLPILAERNGISYEALLDEVVQNALKRTSKTVLLN